MKTVCFMSVVSVFLLLAIGSVSVNAEEPSVRIHTTDINICNANTGLTHSYFTSNKTCITCKHVVELIKEMMVQPLTEKCLEALLHKACAEFKSELEVLCVDIVDKYVPVLLRYAKDHIQSDKVCQLVHLCPKV